MTEEAHKNVLEIIADIKNNQQHLDTSKIQNDEIEVSKHSEHISEKEPIRGIPKSGRFWKSKKEKFSTINKTKGLRANFEKKTSLRLELKRTKELSKQKLEELNQKELERKERRRENIKRSEINKQKAEIVQVITNTAKLRRMKKKQLRFIEKRDTNKQVET